jgi:hypothetical protein
LLIPSVSTVGYLLAAANAATSSCSLCCALMTAAEASAGANFTYICLPAADSGYDDSDKYRGLLQLLCHTFHATNSFLKRDPLGQQE